MRIDMAEVVRARVRELEALDAQIHALTLKRDAIVEELADAAKAIGPVASAPAPRADTSTPRSSAPSTALATPRTRASAPSASPMKTEQRQARVEALARALVDHPDAKLHTLVEATGLESWIVKDVLSEMRAAGRVEAIGVRAGMRYRLVAPPQTVTMSKPLVHVEGGLESHWNGAQRRSVLHGDSLDHPDHIPALATRNRGPQP